MENDMSGMPRLAEREMEVLAQDFSERPRAKLWIGKKKSDAAEKKLLGRLKNVCSIIPEDGDKGWRALLAALVGSMSREIKPENIASDKRAGPACALAAALSSGSLDVAEALWENASKSWWRGAEALAVAAQDASLGGIWLERLLPCWQRREKERSYMDGDGMRMLCQRIHQERGRDKPLADKQWAMMAAQMWDFQALTLGALASQWGAGFEDWGRVALAVYPNQAGELFTRVIKQYSIESMEPQSACWGESLVADLAQRATRSPLLFAIIWTPAHKRYADVAKKELARRGQGGIGGGDVATIVDALQKCFFLQTVFEFNGYDQARLHALRRSIIDRCPGTDLEAVAKAFLKRQRYAWSWRWSLSRWRLTRSREIRKCDVSAMANTMLALAESSAEAASQRMRSMAGLGGEAFESFFLAINAKRESAELAKDCPEVLASSREPRERGWL